MSLDSLMDSLVSLSDVGDCVTRVEHLLKELKSLEEKAQVHLSAADLIFTYLIIPTYKCLVHNKLKQQNNFKHNLNNVFPPVHSRKSPAPFSAWGPADPEQPLCHRFHSTQMC